MNQYGVRKRQAWTVAPVFDASDGGVARELSREFLRQGLARASEWEELRDVEPDRQKWVNVGKVDINKGMIEISAENPNHIDRIVKGYFDGFDTEMELSLLSVVQVDDGNYRIRYEVMP